MINLPAVKELKTGSRAAISFELPQMFYSVWQVFKEKNKTGYWNVRISRPKQPRTTGPESQCNAGNGFCQQIAIHTGNSFAVVKMYTKTEAIGRGYSYETMPDGAVFPISEADASTEDDYHWIGAIKQLADELGIRLIEGERDD